MQVRFIDGIHRCQNGTDVVGDLGQLRVVEIEAEADWLDDFLIFQDTPLALAMQEVERRYGTQVEVGDPVLLDRTLTMWFTSRSLEEVMTVVCSVIDAQCSIEDGRVHIGSRNGGADR